MRIMEIETERSHYLASSIPWKCTAQSAFVQLNIQLQFLNLKTRVLDFIYTEEDIPPTINSPSLLCNLANYSKVQTFFLKAPNTKAVVIQPAVIYRDCQLEGYSASALEKEHANQDSAEEIQIFSPQNNTTASVHSDKEKSRMQVSSPQRYRYFLHG